MINYTHKNREKSITPYAYGHKHRESSMNNIDSSLCILKPSFSLHTKDGWTNKASSAIASTLWSFNRVRLLSIYLNKVHSLQLTLV